MTKNRILVFPCGSEVALEIHRSLKYNLHFDLIGGSSVSDHGRFVYDQYVENLPHHLAPNFIEEVKKVISIYNVQAIYPAMDSVAVTFKRYEKELGVKIIGSSLDATLICSSKIALYEFLKNKIPIPKWTSDHTKVEDYPIFVKPDVGYGSREVCTINNKLELNSFIDTKGIKKYLYSELLTGVEYTIDCFSNINGHLLFSGVRERLRVSNGISVNTKISEKHQALFNSFAAVINEKLKPRAGWFFQMKEDSEGNPKLLEVAARIAGSSSLFRATGVNFSALSLYDAFGEDVSVFSNSYEVELDRSLSNSYKINLDYKKIYIDYDDCILIEGEINSEAICLLYRLLNKNIKLILLTKHSGDLYNSLKDNRIDGLFDEVIHLRKDQSKADFIDPVDSIFIDDSFSERFQVKAKLNIPVFSVDMIEILL